LFFIGLSLRSGIDITINVATLFYGYVYSYDFIIMVLTMVLISL